MLDWPPASVTEAIEASGLGWSVTKAPISIYRGGTPPDWACPASEVISGYYATRPQGTLRRCSDRVERYHIVQNHEGFAFVDRLLGSAIDFETAGSLHGGRRVWVLATLPKHVEVGGDAVGPMCC